jgi:hypothetical protein
MSGSPLFLLNLQSQGAHAFMKRFVTLLILSLFAFVSAYAQTVSVDDIYSNKGSEITIPIKISDNTATNFTSGQFILQYDSSIVEILSVTIGSVLSDPSTTLENRNTFPTPGTGEYRVAISSTVPFTKGDGTLAVLTARVKNYGQSNLTLVNTLLNNDVPTVVNGLLNTSIPVTISGPERLDQGTTGTYSVSVGDLNARNITSFQFTIGFDSNLLNVSNITNGAILDGLTTEKFVNASAVRVAYGSQTALAGSGVLFTFEATANSSNTGTSTFNFSDVQFNTGIKNGEDTDVVTTPAFGVMVQDYVFITLEGNSLSTTLGGTSAVDIVTSDLTNEGVFSYQFVLDYPENDVAIDSVVYLTDLNANQTGQRNITGDLVIGAAASQTAYTGAGSLARVYVRNLTKGTHTLSFNSFTVNTGSPIASTSNINLTINNTAPSAPVILVPGAGDTVNVAGLPTATIVPAWSAATDAEMDSLNYTWELATTMSFDTNTKLLSVNTARDTSITLTNAAVEALLVANGVTRGQSITLYHRAIAKDGDSMTAGAGSAAVFSLGVVNTPPTATNILVPADGDTVNVNGLPTASITPAWSASSDADMDTLNYTWQLAADTNFTTVLLSVPVMTDTSITLSVGAVRDLLEANGVMQGGSITLYHRANTNDGDVVVNGNRAAATFSLGVVNTPPTATMITAPADSAIVDVVGLPTAAFVPMWTAATDAEGDSLSYNWQLSVAPDFAAASVLADVPVGRDTLVNLTLGTVDAILAGAGVNVGDTVRVYHRANVTDSIATTEGMSATVWLVRGVVNTPPTAAEITVPAEGTAITIQGDPTAPFVPRWSESTDADGDNVTYTWQLSTSASFDSASVLVSVAALATEQIDLDVQTVANVLDAAGVEVGVPVTLYHRAQATDGKVTTNGISKSVVLTRGTLTNIGEELPVEFGLDQNYPNPFNPVTTISYQVAESRMVSVKIYDMLGRQVATLVNEVQPAGSYNISFDAARLSTGIYIYRMVSGDFVQTRKMTLMK